ncbi:MAG TPA: adenylate/guanylate cyclase domain-containing protein [Bacteroidales bacterium]|nr:adenylate/guanylate cyclase domain-containing protein [Bacteroidales bacterium]
MRSERLKFYFSEDYRFQQTTLKVLALFGSVGHLLFFVILKYAVGFWESLPMRIFASLLFLSLLLLPRVRPFRIVHAWYYEFVYLLVFPVLFMIFLIKNDANAYWAASVIFSSVLYGFLTHPSKAIIIYPLSIAGGLILYSTIAGVPDNLKDIILIHFPAYFIMVLIGIFQTMIRFANAKAERENARSESLLRNILPEAIIRQLKIKQETIAQKFDNTTILFADIAGFTPIAEKSRPEEVINFLNDIFTRFDNLTDKFGVEKIKTIGDAYMVVCGVPLEREGHAEVVSELALAMMDEMDGYNAESGAETTIRIGIHSGPVVAGVIGTKKFAYDIWGDTVNTASRMESNGVPGKIQISEATAALLAGKFRMSCRGEIEIKGKGLMTTYFLESKI